MMNFVLKTRKCVSKTRNVVLQTMNFAAIAKDEGVSAFWKVHALQMMNFALQMMNSVLEIMKFRARYRHSAATPSAWPACLAATAWSRTGCLRASAVAATSSPA